MLEGFSNLMYKVGLVNARCFPSLAAVVSLHMQIATTEFTKITVSHERFLVLWQLETANGNTHLKHTLRGV